MKQAKEPKESKVVKEGKGATGQKEGKADGSAKSECIAPTCSVPTSVSTPSLNNLRPGIVGALTTWFSPSSSLQHSNDAPEADEKPPVILSHHQLVVLLLYFLTIFKNVLEVRSCKNEINKKKTTYSCQCLSHFWSSLKGE